MAVIGDAAPGHTASLIPGAHYFEDFEVGQRMRHARGATVTDVESSLVSKQVMNTAQGNWNEHASTGDVPFGAGRVVFGLVTASLVFGLVYVNSWSTGTVETAFGGYKRSGFGREKGIESLREYTQLKCVIVAV